MNRLPSLVNLVGKSILLSAAPVASASKCAKAGPRRTRSQIAGGRGTSPRDVTGGRKGRTAEGEAFA
eukprot:SAG22_NODE_16610_length_321_cov_1.265766_1_plen_66_part_10